jgi:hypothetical protein
MKKKLTEMNTEELMAYIRKHSKTMDRYESGSIKWRECNRRIKRANKFVGASA